jgi:hemin uptake protein HemP
MQAVMTSSSALSASQAGAFAQGILPAAMDVASDAPNLPAVDSHSLLKGHKAVTIHHNGSLYRLQATRLGKLILTK